VILSPFNADKVFRIHNDQYRIFGQVGGIHDRFEASDGELWRRFRNCHEYRLDHRIWGSGHFQVNDLAGLLIVGLADNLTDSLSIHIYQESEKRDARAAFQATLDNFVTRLVISLSFVMLVLAFSSVNTVLASLAWGSALLTGLTWFVARSRGANVTTEVLKHLAVAAVVIAVSHAIGILINTLPASAV
jgi:hypothetical protein